MIVSWAVGLLLAAQAATAADAGKGPFWFEDVTESSGVRFVHFNGMGGRRYLVETMGSGVCLFDYDGDGRDDIYLMQGAPTPGLKVAGPQPANALFRNLGGLKFEDVTAEAGVGDTGQGQGCAAADVDGDGDVDLYVVNFGANVLYRNDGDGTFTDVTAEAGVGDDRWGSGAAFADIDGDGWLDLYVVNYVDFRYETHKKCGYPDRSLEYYCSPKAYGPEVDVLYRNTGEGRFEDATREAGVYNDTEANGLGVMFGDVDADGDMDIYVANDGRRNFLYRNDGKGRFKDVAMIAGVGFSESGLPQAGMGVDFGDYDNDLALDIIVTHLSNETNELYRNRGRGIFTDPTFRSGIGSPSLLFVGFGVAWVDLDLDSDLDLFVANGHILDNVTSLSDVLSYAQPNQIYENRGDGTFAEVASRCGPGLAPVEISRGLAHSDLDDDGDLDVVLSNNGQRAVVLRNDSPRKGRSLRLRLRGAAPNVHAIGARVHLAAGGVRQVREVRAGHSYQSQSGLDLHFGITKAAGPDSVEVWWPGGGREAFAVAGLDRLHVLTRGKGKPAAEGE